MTAADVSRDIRGHWGIENKSHYATPSTGKTTARLGRPKARTPSHRSGTSPWDYSASRTRTPSRKPQNGSAATGCGLSSL
jgi:hypothetical protein